MKVGLDHAAYSSAAHHGGITIRDSPTGKAVTSFISMDQPTHTGRRQGRCPIVTPNNLHNLEAMIRQRAAEVLDSLPRIETFDWVEKVSIELTTMMLATLFVFPWKDKHLLTYWSDISITDINAPGALVTSDKERLDVQR